jgi:hypothetical protein
MAVPRCRLYAKTLADSLLDGVYIA